MSSSDDDILLPPSKRTRESTKRARNSTSIMSTPVSSSESSEDSTIPPVKKPHRKKRPKCDISIKKTHVPFHNKSVNLNSSSHQLKEMENDEITNEDKELQKTLEHEFDEILKKGGRRRGKTKPVAIPQKPERVLKQMSLPKNCNGDDSNNNSNNPINKLSEQKVHKISSSLPQTRAMPIPNMLNNEQLENDDDDTYYPDDDDTFWWNDEEKTYWDTLTANEQNDLKQRESDVKNFRKLDIPGRFHILKSRINLSSKAMILRKWEQIEQMEPTDNEFFKLNRWMDGVMRIPFGRNIPFPVRRDDHPHMIHQFLNVVSRTLHKSVYGHEHAKERLLQFVAQNISNPNTQGHCIALCGPPGIGKTSLIKQGVSAALGRPFAFLALGGANDASYLEGHHYTYEGSQWGRIADILMTSKCMNPVIFFDELDKISETKQGEEIVGVLTHLTDPSQNMSIQDKYFANIDLDLSKALFIFSLNDETKINPILKDRMFMIHLEGFKIPEKKKIAQQYMWGELLKESGFNENELIISDNTWDWILKNKEKNDPGVRGLRRLIERILLQLNVIRLYPDALVYGSISAATITESLNKKQPVPPPATQISFPFEITPMWIEYFLKRDEREKEIAMELRMLYT